MSVVAYRIPMYFIIFMARLHEHILWFGQTWLWVLVCFPPVTLLVPSPLPSIPKTQKKRRATILEAILSYPFSKRSGSKWTSMGRIWRLTRRKWDEWDDNTAVLTSFPQRKVNFFKANASTATEILPKQSYRGYSAFSSAARFFLPSAPYQIEHNPPYPVPSQPRA